MRHERGDFIQRGDICQRGGQRQLHGAAARSPKRFSTPPGQQQDVSLDLLAVFVRQRLHGRRVTRLDRGLQLRQVGDEARQAREGFRHADAVLVHQDARLDQAAAQLRLRLVHRAGVHEIERKAEREHRQQGAGNENPVRQRRSRGHQLG